MRYRPVPSPIQREQLIGSINTTPLIDVMLVLLIMFILLIPVTNHKVPLDLPRPGPAAGTVPAVYRLALDERGALRLNDRPIREAELASRLAAIRDEPAVELHFRVEGEARYEDFDRVLAVIKRTGIERLGMVDNARFAQP